MIRDWQRYKQLENEKNVESQEERRRLIKRLAMTCRSEDVDKNLEKEGIKKDQVEAGAAGGPSGGDQDLENDLMQDDFFKEYIRKKFEEMQSRTMNL